MKPVPISLHRTLCKRPQTIESMLHEKWHKMCAQMNTLLRCPLQVISKVEVPYPHVLVNELYTWKMSYCVTLQISLWNVSARLDILRWKLSWSNIMQGRRAWLPNSAWNYYTILYNPSLGAFLTDNEPVSAQTISELQENFPVKIEQSELMAYRLARRQRYSSS